MSNKHAYLIMAHNQYHLLIHLLEALDYRDNDLYLHLDRKMKDVDVQQLQQQVKRGNLCILPERYDVKWGDYSQIACELYLLKEAAKKEYAYYHLISGVDFPLKPQTEIHRYFAQNNGVEYVQFEAEIIPESIKRRVSKYHFQVKRQNSKSWLERVWHRTLMALQFSVDRTRNSGVVFQKGANWFSITDSLARFVISQEVFISRYFRHSLCGDEMFLQTIVYNSAFRERVVENNYCDNYSNILYHIDWNRGNPYEFTEEDYDMLMGSGMLFARKFNWNKDKRIVRKLLDAVCDGD